MKNEQKRFMKKKITVFTLCAMLFALCLSASAQQAKKVFRIGVLSTVDPDLESARAETIRVALRERGYIEGQNIAIVYRYEEKGDRARELAAELVRLKVDIILVQGGDQWIRAAKDATTTIPIVMMGSGSNPVAAGLVETLARPGGNVTGITNLVSELGAKRLELLKEAVYQMSPFASASRHTLARRTLISKGFSLIASSAMFFFVRKLSVSS
jgi:putative ABC transport system substrate-binding protein